MNYMKALALPPQKLHWALAVLALLRERPMHPYEMRLLIRERHKDQRLLIKPGSLYHAIAWLEKERFIQAVETVRVGNRPERTVYKILKTGEQALLASLKQLLAEPARETSSLAVALDHAVHLPPLDVAENLERRAELLQQRIQQMDHILKSLAPTVGRINLLEVDFECAQSRSEFAWLKKLIREIRSGSFSWNIQQILGYLRQAHSYEQKQNKRTTRGRTRIAS